MALPVVVVGWGLYFLIRALTGKSSWHVRAGFWPFIFRIVGFVMFPGLMIAQPIVGALLCIGVWPWTWTATALLRLGAPQAATMLAYASPWSAWGEGAKSARLVLWAHHSLSAPEGKIARRAAAVLHRTDSPGDGATVLSGALLAASRAHTEAALELFAGVALMRPELAQRWMRALANHVRLAAAAQHGNWTEVLAWYRLGPLTPTSIVFGTAAKRCLGIASPVSNALGWAAWVAAPRKVHTWRLLRWAEQQTRLTPSPPTGLAALMALQETQLGAAGVAALAGGAQSLTALELDAALRGRISTRAAELGTPTNGDAELQQLQAAFNQNLTQHLLRMWLPVAMCPIALAPYLESVRLQCFDELEQQLQTLCARDTPQQLITGVPLWTMWGRFRTLFARMWMVFPDSRATLMGAIEPALTSLGAELFNVERQTSVALDIFALLYGGREYLSKEAQSRVENNNEI